MKSEISIPQELLAQIDFNNTVNGGMSFSTATAWRGEDGYRLVLRAPGVDVENINIETSQQRFKVSYMVNVLEGAQQMPYYLLNLPLSPEVDINHISAHLQADGSIMIHAPFNDWATGRSRHIDIDM